MTEILLYVVLVVILIIILFMLLKYNTLIRALNRVKRAQSNIEICLNKRFELIPNIVETVKGYSKHESDTIEKIVTLRNNYTDNEKISLKEANKLNNELNKYLAIVEAYPELKANEQYLSLQNKLSDIEDDLEKVRQRYNDAVTLYNTLIETVPNNIVSSIFAFKKADLFQIDNENKKNVKVKF